MTRIAIQTFENGQTNSGSYHTLEYRRQTCSGKARRANIWALLASLYIQLCFTAWGQPQTTCKWKSMVCSSKIWFTKTGCGWIWPQGFTQFLGTAVTGITDLAQRANQEPLKGLLVQGHLPLIVHVPKGRNYMLLSLNRVWFFATSWTVARQALL